MVYFTSQAMTRVSGFVDSLLTSSGLLSGAVGGKDIIRPQLNHYRTLNTQNYIHTQITKAMALTFSRCVVEFRRLAGVTLAHVVDSNDPETV